MPAVPGTVSRFRGAVGAVSPRYAYEFAARLDGCAWEKCVHKPACSLQLWDHEINRHRLLAGHYAVIVRRFRSVTCLSCLGHLFIRHAVPA